jgi:hypothetical protein
LIAQDRTIRRWEQGEQAISGPAWVALEYLLRDLGEIILADQVARVVQERRRSSNNRKRTIQLTAQTAEPAAQ